MQTQMACTSRRCVRARVAPGPVRTMDRVLRGSRPNSAQRQSDVCLFSVSLQQHNIDDEAERRRARLPAARSPFSLLRTKRRMHQPLTPC